jgi:hypothetical protein
MKNSGPMVDLNEMIDALDMSSDFCRFFINKITCQIVNLMEGEDFSDIDDEVEDDLIPCHYISLSGKWELNKYGIVEDFCYSVEDDEIQNNLLNAIQGKGAFGRFKTAIRCHNIEDDWYQFLHVGLKEIAIEFCNKHKMAYQYLPRRNNNQCASALSDCDFEI